MLIAPIPRLDVPTPYTIVEVRRKAVFAGKLGDNVTEDLVLEHRGTKILVHVAGAYHTLMVREGSRLHVGDTVTLRGDVADGSTVRRDRLRKA